MVASFAARAENYAECLLDGAKTAKTPATMAAVFRQCGAKHPERYAGVVAGSGYNRWSPFDQTVDQCTIKNTADVAFAQAAAVISRACCCLYGSAQAQCWTANGTPMFLTNSAGKATCEVTHSQW